MKTDNTETGAETEDLIVDQITQDTPSFEISDESMLATDDGLSDDIDNTDNNKNVDESGNEKTAAEQVLEDAEKASNPDEDKKEGEEGDDNDNINVEELSAAALQVKLLEQSGLKIYNETDKDLSFEQFAQDLPEFVNQSVEAKVEERLQELGKYAEYAKLIDSGISPEKLKPAMEVEKIAGFNVNQEGITQDDLYDLIVKTELRKGRDQESAEMFADAVKAKGLDFMKKKAQTDIDYTKEYIENLKANAKQEHEANLLADQQKAKAEHDSFVKNLVSSDLDKKEQQKIYDFQHKREVPVKVLDSQGQEQITYVSQYEIAMYQAQQDPAKRIALLSFLANGFDMGDQAKNKVKNNLSKELIAALDKKTNATIRNKASRNNNGNNRNLNNNYQESVGDDEIEVLGEVG